MPILHITDGEIHYKTIPLYPGCKRINKETAFENLLLVRDVLNNKGVSFMLIAGTLLGAVREKDFIAHDEDIDIAFIEEDKQKVFDTLPNLLELGFQIARYDRRGLLSIMRNGEYIDFYFFASYTTTIRCCGGWLVLDEFITQTGTIIFKGETFKVPKDYIGFLRCEYGENWQIPAQWFDYNMPKWKIVFLNIKEYIKDMLPNDIYFLLAKRSELAMIRKYECKINAYLNGNK